jgi:copper(I)-binding protein
MQGLCYAPRALALTVLAMLAACRPSPDVPSVSSPWSPATPPGSTVAAAYMKIRSPRVDVLLGATSPVATSVEIHESTEEGGVARMRPLTSVELKPDVPYTFAPGGSHFMLVGLHVPLASDSRYPLTLHFRDAGEITVNVPVVVPGSGPPSD